MKLILFNVVLFLKFIKFSKFFCLQNRKPWFFQVGSKKAIKEEQIQISEPLKYQAISLKKEKMCLVCGLISSFKFDEVRRFFKPHESQRFFLLKRCRQKLSSGFVQRVIHTEGIQLSSVKDPLWS